jgi:hypothetical protein
MTLTNSQPKAIGFYFNSPLPPELEAIRNGEEVSTESALILLEISSSAALSAWKSKQEGYCDAFYFGSAVTNLYPHHLDIPEIDLLWELNLSCSQWLELARWFQDLAECRVRGEKK